MSISIYAYTIKLVIVALSPHTGHNIPKWPQLFSLSSGSVCQQLKNW